jgi:O-antigen/teichoic acid export membrane protein
MRKAKTSNLHNIMPNLVTRIGKLDGLRGTAVTNFVSLGLNTLASVIAARLLGPEGRGELAAIQNLAFFAVSFGILGIPTAAAYYAGKSPKRVNTIFLTAQAFLLLLSIPVYVCMYFLAPQLLLSQSEYVIHGARIFLILIFIQFAGCLPYAMLRGLGKLAIWNSMRVQFSVLWLSVFVAGYLSGRVSVLFVVYGYLAAMLFHNITWILAMVSAAKGPYQLDWGLLPDLLRYGLPSMLTSVPRELNLRVDQLLMAAVLPPESLGLYVVAVAWSGLLSPAMISFAQIAFPHLTALRDVKAQRDFLQGTLRKSVLIGALMGIPMMFASYTVITTVYGAAFKASVPASVILVCASFISNLNNILGESFRGLGMPKWPMVAEIVGLIGAIGSLSFLLPHYGLIGAAMASLISYSIVFVIFVVLLGRKMALSFVPTFIPGEQEIRMLHGYLTKIATFRISGDVK